MYIPQEVAERNIDAFPYIPMRACQSALQPWVSLGLLYNQSLAILHVMIDRRQMGSINVKA
jgi:hypothetical protein